MTGQQQTGSNEPSRATDAAPVELREVTGASVQESSKKGLPATTTDFDRLCHTWELKYDHSARWGMVETPATRDAVKIAGAARKEFSFLRGGAIREIVEHALDNVANHGKRGSISEGTASFGVVGDNVVIQITNPRNLDLPPTLRDQVITTEAGVFRVSAEERDADRTGGGNGLEFMTKYLPYVYTHLVETNKTGHLFWTQTGDEPGGDSQAIFELQIPIPTDVELRQIKDLEARQARAEAAYQEADPVVQEFRGGDVQLQDPELIDQHIGKLRTALRAFIAYPEDESIDRTTRTAAIFDTLTAFGSRAESACEELRNCIVHNCSAYPAQTALKAIETDPSASIEIFQKELPLAAKEEREYTVGAIASYAEGIGPAATPLRDVLLSVLKEGCEAHRIGKALVAIGGDALDTASLEEALSAANESGKSGIVAAVCTIAKEQGELSDGAVSLLLPFLGDKSQQYNVSQALEGKKLSSIQIPALRGMLESVTDDGDSLYYISRAVKQLEGPGSDLVGPLLRLAQLEKCSHYAGEMLAEIELLPTDLEKVERELRALLARGNDRSLGKDEKKGISELSTALASHDGIDGALVTSLLPYLTDSDTSYAIGNALEGKVGSAHISTIRNILESLPRSDNRPSLYQISEIVQALECDASELVPTLQGLVGQEGYDYQARQMLEAIQ